MTKGERERLGSLQRYNDTLRDRVRVLEVSEFELRDECDRLRAFFCKPCGTDLFEAVDALALAANARWHAVYGAAYAQAAYVEYDGENRGSSRSANVKYAKRVADDSEVAWAKLHSEQRGMAK